MKLNKLFKSGLSLVLAAATAFTFTAPNANLIGGTTAEAATKASTSMIKFSGDAVGANVWGAGDALFVVMTRDQSTFTLVDTSTSTENVIADIASKGVSDATISADGIKSMSTTGTGTKVSVTSGSALQVTLEKGTSGGTIAQSLTEPNATITVADHNIDLYIATEKFQLEPKAKTNPVALTSGTSIADAVNSATIYYGGKGDNLYGSSMISTSALEATYKYDIDDTLFTSLTFDKTVSSKTNVDKTAKASWSANAADGTSGNITLNLDINATDHSTASDGNNGLNDVFVGKSGTVTVRKMKSFGFTDNVVDGKITMDNYDGSTESATVPFAAFVTAGNAVTVAEVKDANGTSMDQNTGGITIDNTKKTITFNSVTNVNGNNKRFLKFTPNDTSVYGDGGILEITITGTQVLDDTKVPVISYWEEKETSTDYSAGYTLGYNTVSTAGSDTLEGSTDIAKVYLLDSEVGAYVDNLNAQINSESASEVDLYFEAAIGAKPGAYDAVLVYSTATGANFSPVDIKLTISGTSKDNGNLTVIGGIDGNLYGTTVDQLIYDQGYVGYLQSTTGAAVVVRGLYATGKINKSTYDAVVSSQSMSIATVAYGAGLISKSEYLAVRSGGAFTKDTYVTKLTGGKYTTLTAYEKALENQGSMKSTTLPSGKTSILSLGTSSVFNAMGTNLTLAGYLDAIQSTGAEISYIQAVDETDGNKTITDGITANGLNIIVDASKLTAGHRYELRIKTKSTYTDDSLLVANASKWVSPGIEFRVVEGYHFVYNLGNGQVKDGQTLTDVYVTDSNEDVVLEDGTKVEYVGADFLGWSYTNGATTPDITPTDAKNFSAENVGKAIEKRTGADINLYAVWQERSYSLAFDKGAGSVTKAAASKTFKVSASDVTLPSEGYVNGTKPLVSWSVTESGKTASGATALTYNAGATLSTAQLQAIITAIDETAKTTSLTLYAQYGAALKSVTVTPATLALQVGGATGKVSATATDEDNADVTSKATFTYTSSDPAVATVAADGTVTAVAAGTTNITATAKLGSNELTSTNACVVTVTKAAKKAATIKANGKNVKKVTLKKATVAKKKQVVKITTNSKGTVKVTNTTAKKALKKYVKISGKKVTIKKGAKKGTYKVKVTVAAKGNYKKTTKTIKIVVK